MSRSFAAQAPARAAGLAMGHTLFFGFPVPRPDLPLPRGAIPASYLISSAEDMSHYLVAQLRGEYRGVRILSHEGIAQMHQPAAVASMVGAPPAHYAMGWFVSESGVATVLSHGGNVADFSADIALVPSRDLGIAMLYNADNILLLFRIHAISWGVLERVAGMAISPFDQSLQYLTRALLGIALAQLVAFAISIATLRRWSGDARARPRGFWRFVRVGAPLAFDLAIASSLVPLAGGYFHVLLLNAPDLTWIILGCGIFSLAWGIGRTVAAIAILRRAPASGQA